MGPSHVVVDGSNLATEGRKSPSLRQLRDAIGDFEAEFKPEVITVIVDATFPNRIDADEADEFQAALDAGEMLTPPAGAIGRGDAFVLQVADRVDAAVLSNDSFQEFHGEYRWLFDEGRLIGGKPVPAVGWVFVDRAPVRGPKSRRSVREAKKAKKSAEESSDVDSSTPTAKKSAAKKSAAKKKAADKKAAAKKTAAGKKAAKKRAPGKKAAARHDASESTVSETGLIDDPNTGDPNTGDPGSTDAATDSSRGSGRRRRRRRSSRAAPEGGNELVPLLEFAGATPPGTEVTATIDRFSSHGVYARVGDITCYVPIKAMGDPPPTRARDLMTVGDEVTFVVDHVDATRRSVDLAVPGHRLHSSDPDTGVDDAEIATSELGDPNPESRGSPMATKKAAAKKSPAKKKAAAKKAVAKKKAAAKKAPAKKKAAAKKAPAKKKAAAKKAPAKKKAAAKKAPAKKKAAAKKAPAKKKATAKKAAARRR